jgi:hypothetical protein
MLVSTGSAVTVVALNPWLMGGLGTKWLSVASSFLFLTSL